MSFEGIDDFELLELAKQDDQQAINGLFARHIGIVSAEANRFFLLGGDKDDLMQEGLIGLYNAIRKYDLESDLEFKYFARRCVRNSILDAVKSANRDKHKSLNDSVSYDSVMEIAADSKTPEELFLQEEFNKQFEDVCERVLSELQKQVLKHYLDGYSYQQIADMLKANYKQVDNAITQIKIKLRENLKI